MTSLYSGGGCTEWPTLCVNVGAAADGGWPHCLAGLVALNGLLCVLMSELWDDLTAQWGWLH